MGDLHLIHDDFCNIIIYTVYTVSKVHVICYLSCPASVLGSLFMFTTSQNQASLRVLWHYLSQIQFSFRSIAWVPYRHWTGEAVNEETHKTKPEAHKECRTRSGHIRTGETQQKALNVGTNWIRTDWGMGDTNQLPILAFTPAWRVTGRPREAWENENYWNIMSNSLTHLRQTNPLYTLTKQDNCIRSQSAYIPSVFSTKLSSSPRLRHKWSCHANAAPTVESELWDSVVQKRQ